MLGVVGLGALFLGSLLSSFVLISALDFLGMGVPPPSPSLGSMIREGMMMLQMSSTEVIRAGLALCACASALYTATDALIGFFSTKDAIARLNE
jgi:ABC-type dipeptide/oligopeptide/nickel transport system permease subunit